jgi:NAD(P)-dependent dehydrogenase (short-subunit alcohol dehydrogenase family)
MFLENKNAVIYGGGGAIGGAVARAFAREGAKVFLAGSYASSNRERARGIRIVHTAQDSHIGAPCALLPRTIGRDCHRAQGVLGKHRHRNPDAPLPAGRVASILPHHEAGEPMRGSGVRTSFTEWDGYSGSFETDSAGRISS